MGFKRSIHCYMWKLENAIFPYTIGYLEVPVFQQLPRPWYSWALICCSLLGRLPKAKVPRKDFNACIDILFTVLKGHYIAVACSVLGIKKMDEGLPALVELKRRGVEAEQRTFIFGVAREVVGMCGVMEQAILGGKVADSRDGVHNYASVFMHYTGENITFTLMGF